MYPTIKGAVKSITIWSAAVIETLGEVAPYVTPDALKSLGLDAHTVTVVCRVLAAVMFYCRIITKESLVDKGSPAVLPAPTDKH